MNFQNPLQIVNKEKTIPDLSKIKIEDILSRPEVEISFKKILGFMIIKLLSLPKSWFNWKPNHGAAIKVHPKKNYCY